MVEESIGPERTGERSILIQGKEIPSWLGFREQEEIERLSDFGKQVVTRLTFIPEGMLSTSRLEEIHSEVVDEMVEGNIEEDESVLLLEPIQSKHQELAEIERSKVESDVSDEALESQTEVMGEVKDALATLIRTQAATNQLTKEQMRALQRGYQGFVGAESAQAPFSPEWFETQPQQWYTELDRDWRRIIKQRIYFMRHSYLKRMKGMISMEDILYDETIRFERDTIQNMWEQMPGFKEAFTTIFGDLFTLVNYHVPNAEHLPEDERTIRFLKLRPQGVGILNNFIPYKDAIIDSLKDYLKSNGERPEGVPKVDPEVEAEAAFAAAFNLIHCSDVIESADSGDYGFTPIRGYPKPKVGERTIKNSEVWGEQIRASDSLGQRGRAKFGKEAGSDEAWLGGFGMWIAERYRHGGEVSDRLSEGREPLVPEKLAMSLFETIDYPDDNEENFTLSDKLMQVVHSSRRRTVNRQIQIEVGVRQDDGEIKNERRSLKIGLRLPREDAIDFGKIKYSEMWAIYMDARDSAWKVYKAIAGKFKPGKDVEDVEEWGNVLSNALSKLRKTHLEPIYKSDSIIEAMIAGNYGLEMGTDMPILKIEGPQYDDDLSKMLTLDRFFTGLPDGARKRILRFFRAQDTSTILGALFSAAGPGVAKERERERLKAKRKLPQMKSVEK